MKVEAKETIYFISFHDGPMGNNDIKTGTDFGDGNGLGDDSVGSDTYWNSHSGGKIRECLALFSKAVEMAISKYFSVLAILKSDKLSSSIVA